MYMYPTHRNYTIPLFSYIIMYKTTCNLRKNSMVIFSLQCHRLCIFLIILLSVIDKQELIVSCFIVFVVSCFIVFVVSCFLVFAVSCFIVFDISCFISCSMYRVFLCSRCIVRPAIDDSDKLLAPHVSSACQQVWRLDNLPHCV